MIKIDPASLDKLKAELKKIPKSPFPRSEQNRLRLKEAVRRLEKENKVK